MSTTVEYSLIPYGWVVSCPDCGWKRACRPSELAEANALADAHRCEKRCWFCKRPQSSPRPRGG